MDEKTIQRIKKLQALAERGVGGEKTTAQKKLAKLLKDNGINSLDELQKEISEEYRKYSEHEVKKFRAVPEITHRRWKELGLMKPLEPDQTAQYKFSDLQMSLYYTIYI